MLLYTAIQIDLSTLEIYLFLMGAIYSCLFPKKIEPTVIVRRDPVKTCEEVLAAYDGLDRILYAIAEAPPGTVFRWDKMLAVATREIEPSPAQPDPLRINIDMEELKKILRTVYKTTSSASSDGILLCREYIPKMYDKHSLERGKRVSQREREEKNLLDECFAYGELDFEVFMTIYTKVSYAYGKFQKVGVFYDLGCGVGNLVYCAALFGNFVKCVGIEAVQALYERGAKRIGRWESFKMKFPSAVQNTNVDFMNDNFLYTDAWLDATFILLHWTAFNQEQVMSTSRMLEGCREGTIIVAITHAVRSSDFELLIKDSCQTSWGEAEFYVQEKLTPGKKIKLDFVSSNANNNADGGEEEGETENNAVEDDW